MKSYLTNRSTSIAIQLHADCVPKGHGTWRISWSMFTGSDWFCHHSGSKTSYEQKLRYLPTTLTEPVPSLSGPAPHTADASMHRSYSRLLGGLTMAITKKSTPLPKHHILLTLKFELPFLMSKLVEWQIEEMNPHHGATRGPALRIAARRSGVMCRPVGLIFMSFCSTIR